MAVGGEVFRTYEASWPGQTASAGLTEQLSSTITILDPDEAPAWAMLGKEQIVNQLFDWPIDALAATSTAANLEGADYSDIAVSATARVRIQNCTQIFASGFAVTRSEQRASTKGGIAGVRDELGYQATKKMKELPRNFDARLFALGTAVASATASTSPGRRMGALRGFTGAGRAVITGGVTGAFATSSFATLAETMDTAGANPDSLWVSSGVKADITNLILNNGAFASSTNRNFNQDVNANGSNQWGGTIDVIQNDFNRTMVIRDRWIPQGTATGTAATLTGDAYAYFLMDRSMVKWCVFDAPSYIPLPPAGLSERAAVNAEISVKILHPSAVGVALSVTT